MENNNIENLKIEECLQVLYDGLNKATKSGCFVIDECVALKMVFEKLKSELLKN